MLYLKIHISEFRLILLDHITYITSYIISVGVFFVIKHALKETCNNLKTPPKNPLVVFNMSFRTKIQALIIWYRPGFSSVVINSSRNWLRNLISRDLLSNNKNCKPSHCNCIGLYLWHYPSAVFIEWEITVKVVIFEQVCILQKNICGFSLLFHRCTRVYSVPKK